MDRGFELQRYIVQSDWRPPVMRQYDWREVKRNFPEQVRGNDALILLIHEGPSVRVDVEKKACAAMAAEMACDPAPEAAVHRWFAERNHVTGFEPLLQKGFIVDTIEVAATWDRIGAINRNVIRSLYDVEGIRTASSHSSHGYRSGVNLYFTFAARPDRPEKMASIYNECWRRTMEETLAGGGSISHHHGIGRVRREWMTRELGAAGVGLLTGLKNALDPYRIMNPGVLLPHD